MISRGKIRGLVAVFMFAKKGRVSTLWPTLFCALFLFFSFWAAFVEISYSSGERLVTEIRGGYSPLNWSDARAELVLGGLGSFPDSCNWQHREVSVTLSLAMLDRVLVESVGYEKRMEAFQSNLDLIKRAIACAPLRQGFWVSYAQLDSIIGFSVTKFEKMTGFMRAISPVQRWDVKARTDAYLTMPGLEFLIAMRPVQQDFASLLRYGLEPVGLNAIKILQGKGLPVGPIFAELDPVTRKRILAVNKD